MTLCVCRYWVFTRLVACGRTPVYVRRMCVLDLMRLGVKPFCRITLSFVGVWFGFVRSALLLVVGRGLKVAVGPLPRRMCHNFHSIELMCINLIDSGFAQSAEPSSACIYLYLSVPEYSNT